MHRFKQPTSNKHGPVGPTITWKNGGNCETTIDQNIEGAQPIWVILNMSEEAYYEKFHQPIVSIDAVEAVVVVAEAEPELVETK